MADRAQQHQPAGLRSPRRAALPVALAIALVIELAAMGGAPADTRGAATRPGLHRSSRERWLANTSVESRLSLAQLAGQRIIYAYAGLTPPQLLLARIREGEAAGVIFFGPNISSPAQMRAVVGQLQAANASSPVHAPLLMMTDQEGGLIRRLPGAPTLSERQIGESTHRVALAAQAGTGAGDNLRTVGITVNLAPVLDVFRQPGNFIAEYQRSYSSNATVVAQLSARPSLRRSSRQASPQPQNTSPG